MAEIGVLGGHGGVDGRRAAVAPAPAGAHDDAGDDVVPDVGDPLERAGPVENPDLVAGHDGPGRGVGAVHDDGLGALDGLLPFLVGVGGVEEGVWLGGDHGEGRPVIAGRDVVRHGIDLLADLLGGALPEERKHHRPARLRQQR